jgi:hypothetical protein
MSCWFYARRRILVILSCFENPSFDPFNLWSKVEAVGSLSKRQVPAGYFCAKQLICSRRYSQPAKRMNWENRACLSVVVIFLRYDTFQCRWERGNSEIQNRER